MKLAVSLATLTLAVAAYSQPADAQTFHANASQPAARCQGALPVFETAIRKRPLAIQNEGAAPSFVTCAYEVDAVEADAFDGPILLDTYFVNHTESDVNLTCTAVSGWDTGTNEFVSLSTPISPGEQGNLFWLAEDFESEGLVSGLIAISCNLPPGVGINDSYIFWLSED